MTSLVKSCGDISSYIRYVNDLPLLSEKEERELALQFSEGDKAAAQRLILAHLRLVVKIAFSYRNYGAAIQDLISEGSIGLIHAVKKFKVDMGCRLATYAAWWIRSSIQEFIIRSWSLLKMNSSHLKKNLFYRAKIAKSKIQQLSRRAMHLLTSDSTSGNCDAGLDDLDGGVAMLNGTDSDVDDGSDVAAKDCNGMSSIAVCNLSEKESLAERDMINSRYMISFDHQPGEDERSHALSSTLSDDNALNQEGIAIKNEEYHGKVALLREALKELSEREKEVIIQRQFKNTTLKSIALSLGVSAERVRQIEQAAMCKLRRSVSSANSELIC